MKILVVHRYFHPDSPTYAFLLNELTKSYSEYFEKVSVLTSMPSYYGSNNLKGVSKKETTFNINIRRVKLLPEKNRNIILRTLNSVFFSIIIFIHLLFNSKRYDVVQVATTPPILSAMAVALASKIKRFRYLYHCQDLYPDITNINQENSKGIIYDILLKLDKFIMYNAWKVVVLSQDMKDQVLSSRKINSNKIAVINNFNFNRKKSTSFVLSDEFNFIKNSYKKKVIYAGNLGYFQNLELVFKVMNELVKTEGIMFIVVGDGVKRKELEEHYKHENIIFTGFQQNETVQQLYSFCNLGIAPVIKGIEKVAYPSKIISYTIEGLPVLSFSSHNSSIESFILENEMGDNYAFEGEEELKNKIQLCLEKKFDKQNIKEIASSQFGSKYAFNKWKMLYQSIITGKFS